MTESEQVAFAATMVADPAPFASGTVVGHYSVMRLIGRGGMGEVYLARDARLGRKVALKVVNPSMLGSPEAIARFLSEAKTTARFSHPHIVQIYDVGEHDGAPFVALEYLEGGDLRSRLRERRLSIPEALRVVLAVAEALEEAHRHGVLHRDLKPENVVIPLDGRVRVVDFGLSKTVQVTGTGTATALSHSADTEAAPNGFELSASLRASSSGRAGTPLYMAPEQWQDLDCSGATDVWALGVVLYELTTGTLPYQETTVVDQAQAVCAEQPAPAADASPPLPVGVSQLIANCLRKTATERPSAKEVVAALRDLVGPGDKPLREQSPFRGLLPFTEQDAESFLGREAEVSAAVERLRLQAVLPVVGMSGAGKTSFVRAGLLPRLREQERWTVLQLRPGARPFEALAKRLVRANSVSSSTPPPSEPGSAQRLAVDAERLAERLAKTPRKLALELRALADSLGSQVLLFVDQLEEVFTLCSDEQSQQRFVEALHSACDDVDDPVRLVFTIRDDFLGRLALLSRVGQRFELMLLARLDADALLQTLVQPVVARGFRYEDDALPQQMIEAVSSEPACLPLLQFAARRLWEARDAEAKLLTHEAYQQMGGVEGALAGHADSLLEELQPHEQSLAREILLQLITPERTRQIGTVDHLLDGRDGAEEVLERLRAARLVSVHKGSRTAATVELAHESLIDRWHTLSRWIDDNREELALVAEVQQAAEMWDRRGRREQELWQGDALLETKLNLSRLSAKLSPLQRDFIDAAWGRERRRVRNKRLAVAVAVVGLAVIAVVLGVQKREAQQQRAAAESREKEAVEQRAEALREAASGALARGRVFEARAKLRAAFELGDATVARALWWRLRDDPLRWSLELAAPIYSADVSMDGRLVAVASQDKSVYLIDAVTRELRVLRGHVDQVTAVAFSLDAKTLASGALDGEIRLWSTRERQNVRSVPTQQGKLNALDFSRDGRSLAAASRKGVRIYETSTGKLVAKLASAQGRQQAVRFDPSAARIATAGTDGVVRLWSLDSKRVVTELRDHRGTVYALAYSSDGSRLLSAGRDRVIRVWNAKSAKIERKVSGHTARIVAVAYRPDGKRFASASYDGSVREWDAATGRQLRSLEGHSDAVRAVAYGDRGRVLISAGLDRRVQLSTASPRPEASAGGHAGGVYAAAFSGDGEMLATAGGDRTVRLWNAASGRPHSTLAGHNAVVQAVAFSPDGSVLVSGGTDHSLRTWQLPSGAPGRVLLGHSGAIYGVDFSPDGKLLASGSRDQTVRLWWLANGRERSQLSGHRGGGIYRVRFSPDGKLVASAGFDKTVRLWDVEAGGQKRKLEHPDRVYGLAFSPDGARIATGCFDGRVRLADVDGGELRVLGKHVGRVYDVAFNRDGLRVGSASSDGSARIWRIDRPEHVALRGHRGEVNTIAFSADGRAVATAGDDTTVRLWTIDGTPRWRGPLLAGDHLLTHRGWITVAAGRQAKPPAIFGRAVLAAVQKRAQLASQSERWLCMRSLAGRFEMWDLRSDRKESTGGPTVVDDVLALPGGCAALAAGGVRVHLPNGKLRQLAFDGRASAIGRASGGLLVAAGDHVYSYDSAQSMHKKLRTGLGVSAVTRLGPAVGVGAAVVVGYQDGNLAVVGSEQTSTARFEGVPSSEVVRIVAGPRDTLVVGYANGSVGLWNRQSGARLRLQRLHGRVAHLHTRPDGVVIAATDLGQHLRWDLRLFEQDYCALLKELWAKVPVVWHAGAAKLVPAPTGHSCGKSASQRL